MHTRLAAILAVLLLAAPAGAQQAPPPIFRAEVEAVEIDAFVTDAQGNPVTDLTADDFEILENGQRQEITSFGLVNIPIERAERPLYSPTAIEPDVFTNRGGEGRLYLIALDEVRPDLALRTRRFLRHFIEQHFAANDVAAIVYVGRGNSGDAQDFTSNRRLLLQALDKYTGGFPGAGSTLAPVAALDGVMPEQRSSPERMEAEFLTRARMRALKDLLEFMGGLRGRRKTMIYVTEELGDIYSVLDYNGGARSLAFDDLHAAVAAATRGNVSIYPVDPRGLSPAGPLGETGAAPEPEIASAERLRNLSRQQELRALAEATGGFAVVNSNNFQDAFERIVRENSTYYVLGFTATTPRRDGRYQRVEVRVRRPGLQVRARNGYLAPMRRGSSAAPAPLDSRLAPAVAESIRIPMPNPAVAMAVSATPFKGSGRDADVALAIEFDGAKLGLTDTGGSMSAEIEVATVPVAAAGKVHEGDRHRLRLTLKPDTYERALTGGVRVLSQVSLPPGRYQLRVAGGNVAGPAGSVIADLEVPDFTRETLAMSGVALTSSSASQAFTAPVKDPLRDLLPSPPTAVREFARGDRLTLYTEVYENRRDRAAHTVSLKAELRSDEGRVLQAFEEDRSSTELGGRAGGYGFRAELPLDVEPGIYVIHVEAQANISGRPTVGRDVQIRVK